MTNQEHEDKLSSSLLDLLAEVGSAVGKRIQVRDITTHPLQSVRGAFGVSDDNGIWVAPGLRPEIAEAVAAHEAMHLLQYAGGWKIGALRIHPSGKAAILHELVSSVSTFILDPHADFCAQERGFQIADALRLQWEESRNGIIEKTGMDNNLDLEVLRSMWDRISTAHQRSKTVSSVAVQDVIDVDLVGTLVEAVDYSNMALRAASLRIPFPHDELYNQYLPGCREFGLALIEGVAIFDLRTRAGAEQALRRTLRYIGMNPRVMMIISPQRLPT